MATIQKRGKGYLITVSNGYDVSHRQIRETTTYVPDQTKTPKQQEKEVKAFAFEFEQLVKSGSILDGRTITLQAFFYRWLSEYAEITLEVTTVEWYKQMFKNKILPRLGHLKLANIKPLHIQSFCNDLTKIGSNGEDKAYSPGSVKRYHTAISAVLNKAVEWELIASNPAKKVSLPKQKTVYDNVKCFTPEQTITFLNALNESYPTEYKAHTRTVGDTIYNVSSYTGYREIPMQFKVLFNIAIYGGLRLGELLALKWEDVDFEKATISVNKSVARVNHENVIKSTKNKSSERVISLPKSVMRLIRLYKSEQGRYRLALGDKWEGDNFLFIQNNGKLMNKATPYHTLKAIIDKYNSTVKSESDKLPSIRFHDLRHTSATLLIATNIDIKTISARLGHAQTSTTMNIYAHSYKKLDEVASDALEDMLLKGEKKIN